MTVATGSPPLPDLAIASLAAAYRGGAATPVAVAVAVHEAAAASAEATRAWIALVERDELLARAVALETGGPLHGIPFAVKDCIDVAGMPTTAGLPGAAYVPERSAPVVERLLAAGALLVGKTNMDQLSTGLVGTRSPYGACACVVDPERVSGGSSSGSAVAVAAGLVSFALGTDTAGSGRVPAAFNGIVGLKPTRGLVPASGVVPACRSLDCVAVLARGSADARRVLAVAAGPDPADAFSRAAPGRAASMVLARPTRARPTRPAGAPRRFAIPSAPLGGAEPAALAAWDAALAHAAAVADELVPVDVEPFLAAGQLLYDGPWLAERYAAVGALVEREPDGLDAAVREVVLGGRRFTGADVFRGRERLAALAAAAADTWEVADALLLPTALLHPTHAEVAADALGVNGRLGTFTHGANLLDLCAVAVPAAPRADGLPFGVQLLAPAFADDLLLELAAAWEAAAGVGGIGSETVELAVCGAHLSGLPLNGQLLALGARLLRTTTTAPRYRLYALPGGPPARPGLVQAATGEAGAAIEVEVWRLSAAALGALTARIPPPLAIGTVALADGSAVSGFVCEGHAAAGALDVTEHGGWRAYVATAVLP